MKILAITPYPINGPSSRYRIHQFVEPFSSHDIELHVSSFMDEKFYNEWMTSKKISQKILIGLSKGISKRFYESITARKYDLIWIHRQIAPAYHTIFNRMFVYPRVPVVFDMDDAVFTEYPIKTLLRAADGATVGNQYLAKYVETESPDTKVLISPTVVDTKHYTPLAKDPAKAPTVGWIGTAATFKRYLLPVLDDVASVCHSNGAALKVIASYDVAESVKQAGGIFIPWSLQGELKALQDFDIGLMPLEDDKYSRGKCAFKLIEYGAVGIPGVGTRIGANEEVITDNVTGYLTDSVGEMQDRLKTLIGDFELRRKMGRAARVKIEQQYSLASQSAILADYFRHIVIKHAETNRR